MAQNPILSGNQWDTGGPIHRTSPFPTDITSVWSSYASATNYSSTDPTAYVGQIITVVNTSNNTQQTYRIKNTAGELEPFGAGTTYENLSGSTSDTNGNYVIKGAGANTNYVLQGNGEWIAIPSGQTYATLEAGDHATNGNYVVHGPGSTTNVFLQGNGTWGTPTNTTYAELSASDHANNKDYVVKGIGATTNANGFLRNDGTWQTPTNTTYETMTNTASATNVSYVIKGSGLDGNKYLNGKGDWSTPSNTTYDKLSSANTATANGYVVSGAGANTGYYLRGDGSWQSIETTDTKNTVGSLISTNKLYLVGVLDTSASTNDDFRQSYASSPGVTIERGSLAASSSITASGEVSGSSFKPGVNRYRSQGNYGLDMQNSDIVNANSIFFNDSTEKGEGFNFPRSGSGATATLFDTIRVESGIPVFDKGVTMTTNSSVSGGASYNMCVAASTVANPTVQDPSTTTNRYYPVQVNTTSGFAVVNVPWETGAGTTYDVFSQGNNGLVPGPTSAQATTNYILGGNGSWLQQNFESFIFYNYAGNQVTKSLHIS